jgi:hypothetical protein
VATIDDLNSELKRLRTRVRQLESRNTPREDNPLAIVTEDPTNRWRAGGFAAACDASRATVIEQQKQQAREELRANPSAINSRTAQVAFRRTYSAVPTAVLDEIIREMT